MTRKPKPAGLQTSPLPNPEMTTQLQPGPSQWATYPLVHLTPADLNFRLQVEKQIQRMRDMRHEDVRTFRTPEFQAGVRNKLELAIEEYDQRLSA